MLSRLAAAANDVGAPTVAKRLRNGLKQLQGDVLADDEKDKLLSSLRNAVLNTAVRFGKARFAQIVARHVDKATGLPPYIKQAVEWLRES